MGGRHTEEMGGNLSFQEFMFLPLTAHDYIEAQRVTNLLQNRAIQIIQDTEGLNFVGIGLEGGIVASYAREKDDMIPEERASRSPFRPSRNAALFPTAMFVWRLIRRPASSAMHIVKRRRKRLGGAVPVLEGGGPEGSDDR